jgi:hypothetical protein
MKIYQSSDMHSWYQLINAAKNECGYELSEGLDHYLVLTLRAFIDNTDIAKNVLAITYLENINHDNNVTLQNIRYVGDQCLLLSGLFPERATKRNVSLGYYVDMGKNSYMKLASASPHLKLDNELFYELGTHFVGLMDVLQIVRQQG